MKKILGPTLIIFIILLSTSCNMGQPPLIQNTPSIELTLVYQEDPYHSFEDVSATVILKNVGKKSLLVNKRLFFMTEKYPPEMIEGVLLITDSSGNQISLNGFIDIAFPEEEFFIVLDPGQSVERNLSLRNVGFSPQYFTKNEPYTVVIIYQNSLEVTKFVDDKEVKSWIGEVQSNSDTFMIIH